MASCTSGGMHIAALFIKVTLISSVPALHPVVQGCKHIFCSQGRRVCKDPQLLQLRFTKGACFTLQHSASMQCAAPTALHVCT